MKNTFLKPIRSGIMLFILFALFLGESAYAQTVYITRTGAKYHDDGCRYLSKSKIRTTVKDALENEYTACAVCKPPAKVTDGSGQENQITAPAPVRKAKSSQCTARTKANARCSRMTTNSNGKCWQHQ